MNQDTELNTRSRAYAESLVNTHLERRYLPEMARAAVMRVTQARLDNGQAPALNVDLRAFIDRHAIAAEHVFPETPVLARPAAADQRVAALLH